MSADPWDLDPVGEWAPPPWWQTWDGHGGTSWLVPLWSPRRLRFLHQRLRMRWLTWRGY